MPNRRQPAAVLTFRLLCAACVAGAGVLWSAPPATAAPEPNPVPTRWEFQIEPGPLRVGSVDVEGFGPKTFYYFTYTVTNRSGEDRYFAPSFELATDDGAIIRSGKDVPGEVYDTLIDRLGDPLIEDEVSILGNLLQGKENAKSGIVVWPADDLKVDEVKVFAAGFSGETKRYTRPDNGEVVTLRKQLMLRYAVPGEIDPKRDPSLQREGLSRWIMR